MTDYKELSIQMLRETEKVIKILTDVQRQCEEKSAELCDNENE